jgi:membrane-associated phospholipid phosphatase
LRLSSAIRATAWGLVVAGVAAPLLRRRIAAPAVVTQTVAFAAPVGLCVAMRRSRTRDVAACALQMWAYLAAYKSPHDDAQGQAQRVHLDYPIAIDRALGLGELPTVRLQRSLARADRWTGLDGVLVWTHWSWFLVPHASLAYILWRRPERFTAAAAMTYAVFDLGASVYWVLPTAPPWYAATQPTRERGDLPVRRMMVEYGEFFWRDGWGPLYSVFGGNPLAAMPSLHFATSVMAAALLQRAGPAAGAVGWTYAATLGFALVYLGEHYVTDLIAGAALSGVVWRFGPRAAPLLERAAEAVAALEARAHEGR